VRTLWKLVEVGDSLRDHAMPCAHCGHMLSGDRVVVAVTEIACLLESLGSASQGEDFTLPASTGNDETPRPNAATRVEMFPFLTPAEGPDELGRLGPYR